MNMIEKYFTKWGEIIYWGIGRIYKIQTEISVVPEMKDKKR